MAKTPRVDMSLKEIEKLFLDSNTLFKVIPLKIKVTFTELEREELENLEEYANAEDGTFERWILLPDITPLGSLGYIVDKAFGLLPQMGGNTFILPSERYAELCPDMKTFLENCGSVFENPAYEEYGACMTDFAFSTPLLFPPVLPSLVVQPEFSFEEANAKTREALPYSAGDDIDYNGRTVKFESCPADMDFFAPKSDDPDAFVLSSNLAPDLQLRDVLSREGRKTYSLSQRRPGRREIGDRHAPKPITDSLLMLRYDDEDYIAFIFEITSPENVYPLINEGYLSVEDYLDSMKFVLKNASPDCIHKKGYDLFGPDQYFYHDFVMAIHGEDAEKYLQEAKKCGWKEPFVDLKKVFR